jgi:hypothetical protein
MLGVREGGSVVHRISLGYFKRSLPEVSDLGIPLRYPRYMRYLRYLRCLLGLSVSYVIAAARCPQNSRRAYVR